MDARNKILSSIRENKPKATAIPELPEYLLDKQEDDLTLEFTRIANLCGSSVISPPHDMDKWLNEHFPSAKIITSSTSKYNGNISLESFSSPADLQAIDVAFVESRLGVVENGTIWVSEKELGFRILPFITQHLIVFIDAKNLVTNMHQAYKRVQIDSDGFGVFIGGPSKTADIEQSLVVGAQGSRSHTIILG